MKNQIEKSYYYKYKHKQMEKINTSQNGIIIKITDDKALCSHCEKFSFDPNVEMKILQCGHALHLKCIKDIGLSTYGEYVDVCDINKSNIFELSDSTFTKMRLNKSVSSFTCGVEDCETFYSLNSPIFREFGVPKRVEKIIIFIEENGDKFYYDICTLIDVIHLLENDVQLEILKSFTYQLEESFRDEVFECEIAKELTKDDDEFIFHLVTENNIMTVCEQTKCLACLNRRHSNANCLEQEDCHHVSIEKFISFFK